MKYGYIARDEIGIESVMPRQSQRCRVGDVVSLKHINNQKETLFISSKSVSFVCPILRQRGSDIILFPVPRYRFPVASFCNTKRIRWREQ